MVVRERPSGVPVPGRAATCIQQPPPRHGIPAQGGEQAGHLPHLRFPAQGACPYRGLGPGLDRERPPAQVGPREHPPCTQGTPKRKAESAMRETV